MQESFAHYDLNSHTQRNMGLYTADQQLNRNDRRATRQNPNGDRYGLEVQEERDYYPYWAPSPFVDVAVLSDSASTTPCFKSTSETVGCSQRCMFYMNNTMNWNTKGYCDVNHATGAVADKINTKAYQANKWYNNAADCAANVDAKGNALVWYEVSHADNIGTDQPTNNFVCAHTQFARVNQLGNAAPGSVVSQTAQTIAPVQNEVNSGVNANRLMWTVPNVMTAKAATYFPSMTTAYQSCSLRMRYNLSSGDFQQWPVGAVNAGTAAMVDHRNNSKGANTANTPLTGNPYYYIGPGDTATAGQAFVKLKVNTDQYFRTFQDRSYTFAIKPLPSAAAAVNNNADTPMVNYAAMTAAMSSGGKIYNVNVRGKRGNIVQVYPSVEYDFTPNQLILTTHDMVHFQWTGSDYNPQRGCNDATGGPPDPNTFSTAANADQNSRADRSNVVFIGAPSYNTPQNYLNYDHTAAITPSNAAGTVTYAQQMATAISAVKTFAPCTGGATTDANCYSQVMRLAYLNQQQDGGSLALRGNADCLTPTQLNAIANQDTADNHPLNCAKLNAKPYPYFDGGVMNMAQPGWASYYTSRNNNFSNRQNGGVICVKGGTQTCDIDPVASVLQAPNPQVTGSTLVSASKATCYTSVNGENGATANGVTSCIVLNSAGQPVDTIIAGETFTSYQQDNDAFGAGTKFGCAVLVFDIFGTSTIEQQLGLAFGLLAVGLFFSWLAYYLYNRYEARKLADGKFRHNTSWQADMAKSNNASKARPTSGNFSISNPGVKVSRDFRKSSDQSTNRSNFTPVSANII